MSNSRDKRIKKLKKKSIWPSVVGLFVLLSIFFVIFIAMFGVAVADVAQRKVNQSFTTSYNLAKTYNDYNELTHDEINKNIETYIGLSSEIEAIAIFDKELNGLWSSVDTFPKLDNVEEIEFNYDNDIRKIKLLIENDEEQMLAIEDGTVTINEALLKKIDFEKINIDNPFSVEKENAILHVQQWVLIPTDYNEIAVLNNIYIYANDFFMLICMMIFFAVLMCIFTLYYLVTFVALIVNMRKNTKILYYDVATGGNNWLYFEKNGAALLKKNKKGKRNYAMIHLQMRKYRSFCNCFGIANGEALIESFYNNLKKHIKSKEIMVHRENAQFALLINYSDKEILIERINYIVKNMDTIANGMKMYFNVGIYEVEPGNINVEQLYNYAYLACEMLLDEADNQIAFYDDEIRKQQLWERKVEGDMENALINHEFLVYLQPKINAKQEVLAGAEALVRWMHPTEGFVPPNRFIPIFEQNGFILKLDDYMLEAIAKQQAEWIAQGKQLVPISVNISRAHFTRSDLATHICEIVDRYNVPHNVIELELTESAFFDDKKMLLNTVKELREAGFIISMDDFGAGYSSLNSLKELKLDVLKIDADFFRNVDEMERGMLIVSEVIDLARKLNMKIVAEGIESREQVDFLVEQECDLIQGYFFAKPMPISEFEEKYSMEVS